ncbi:MAG: ABC transporter ATP-binding protein [Actinobacteria bacterium]|nr:MAG: ABC transporter ATP-binding protein [Actinomycetota bacterium]
MVRRVARLFKPYRLQVGLVLLSIFATSGLGVANPILSKVVFDRALFTGSGVHLSLLYVLVGLMVGIAIVQSLIGVAQTYLTTVVGQRVMQDLRNRLYEHLQSMSLRFFTATRTGEIQSRLQNDVGGVQSVVTNTASSILSNIVIVASSIVAMIILSWQLTLLSLFLIPAFVYLTYRVGKVRRRIAKETQESLAELSALTEETLSVSGVLLAKVFDRQRSAAERYRDENRRLANLQVRQQMVGRAFFAVVSTFFSITPALTYLVGGFARAHGTSPHITAGTLVAFTALQTRLLFPVGQMLQVSVEVQSSLALFERIFAYLDLPFDIADAPGARELRKEDVRGEVRFDHVYFRYEEPVLPAALEAQAVVPDGDGTRPPTPAREWTLEDVTFEIEPGQLAAIVGPSGAGKTTISYLVPRLYDVTRGGVEIDGHDVRQIKLASLAEIIGMVTQETYLFHASVRENLLYARPDATQEELEAATRAAAIHDRIVELSEGYDTLVGERGYRMSGGEKQRLAIARVILKDPRILILDEATSALDTASERLVQAALEPLIEERTTIAIAHRLSTILAADVIFVLDRGRLVEQGTHEELLRRGGLYADLYAQQFQSGLVEARCEDGVVLSSGEVLTTAAAG